MIIFPAIDIRNGKCVRLIQGDYDREIIYGDAPTEMAKLWAQQEAEWLHIVDLDGARVGQGANQQAIEAIVQAVNIPVQVGGGIRSMDVIEQYIENGVERVIIGTAAITNRKLVEEAVARYGAKIAVSIDAKNGFVATDGWTETTKTSALTMLKELAEIGVQTFVYTDIAKDGMMQGPNFEELKAASIATNVDIIASGGVSTVQDVATLSEMHLYGAIVGKALYEENVTLAQLKAGVKHEA
ncbi:MAG TPA: 1-(5-phosphoribosyl)-5-[(5-phosphoribosylamino)methylideneamino]imidazole-4-carboxamide isomerase [Sporosarcina sp.]|nr:1-(5-phosphoribosyl)-5-[(5-phosphoribosylamino)methylideneamino]imidazole-4-carboxamide isomerase [Sporosarcina sp.]